MLDIEDDGILYAFALPEENAACRELHGADISTEIRNEGLAWVHMDARHPGARRWLEREVKYIDRIILDALLADETRPRIVEYDEGVLLILRGINMNDKADPEDMVSIRLWVDERRIISLQRRPVHTADEMAARIRAGKAPRRSDEFLAMLCARLFEKMEPVLGDLEDRVDDLEEEILDTPDTNLRHRIIDVRRTAITLRRYIAPQKDVLLHLASVDAPWIDEHSRRQFRESYDRVLRYIDDLDSIRERAQIIKDELGHILSDRTNKNLFMLSVVTVIFLPLHFLAGLLGINVAGIPGASHPDAFWIFVIILVAVALVQVVLFKKLRWF